MCTSVILFRKKNKWPVILASNRDEFFERKSKDPKRHWADKPYIIGGLDILKGGTWLAINDYGIVSCIHNRNFKEKNFLPKETRGKIILEILEGHNINEVISILKSLDLSVYNGFNIIIADNKNVYWAKYSKPQAKISVNPLSEGISIITESDPNNLNDKKINKYKKIFSQTPYPNPDKRDWSKWEKNLTYNESKNQKNTRELICFNIDNLFGTVSSSVVSLNSKNNDRKPIIYRYSEWSTNICTYKNINLL